MAKSKRNETPEPAKVSGSNLIISRGDPLAKFILRETNMNLPATLTKDTPNVKAIVKSYVMRSDGYSQENADAAKKFLEKNNMVDKKKTKQVDKES